MMALTGAVLGLVGLELAIAATASFEGDTGAALAALEGDVPSATGEAATMQPLSCLLARVRQVQPALEPEMVSFHHYGDAAAVGDVYGNRAGAMVYSPAGRLDAHTGEVLRITDRSRQSLGRRVYAMVTPLHTTRATAGSP